MDSESQVNKDIEEKTEPSTAGPTNAVPGLDEDSALALLRDADTSAETLSSLARSSVTAKSRKVMLGIVQHARTPRHVSIPLLRRMFTFDLMQITLTPVIAADIKRAAEEQIIVRLESIPAGQKITLGRRASGRVAAELLQESDTRVISPALENPQLTESLVVRSLMKASAPEILFRLVSHHPKWSLRREVQIALLRSKKTPSERAREFARNFSDEFLRSIAAKRG
jgi:hypothetical protein